MMTRDEFIEQHAIQTFSTWVVNCMGGRVYSGIPSRDVAIALAEDLARYNISDERPTDKLMKRCRIEIEARESPWNGTRYLMVTTDGEDDLGVHEERRCASCFHPVSAP